MNFRFKIGALVIAIWALVGCAKDEIDTERITFLKVLETDGPYIARNAIPLADGSIVVGTVGFENEGNSNEYGLLPAQLFKLGTEGELKWQIELPHIVHELWKCLLLSNGNIAVIGFDDQQDSENVGMVILSDEGEVLFSHSFFNETGTSSTVSSVDAVALQNGNLGLVMPSITIAQGPPFLRYVEFSPSLTPMADVNYTPDEIVPDIRIVQPSITQAPSGEILIHGRVLNNIAFPEGAFAFTAELNPLSYEPAFFNVLVWNDSRTPSRLASSPFGEGVWTSSGPDALIPSNNETGFVHNFRKQEEYLYGPKIECWKTNGAPNQSPESEISGYPKNGFIQNVNKCSDGGYILSGTCNINSDQSIPSDYRILLVKLNPELQVEWMRIPNTSSAALGADAVEIPGGFLVSATHYATAGVELPIVFKTNSQGFIE